MTQVITKVVVTEYKQDSAGRKEITEILTKITTVESYKTFLASLGSTLLRCENIYRYHDRTNDRFYSITDCEVN